MASNTKEVSDCVNDFTLDVYKHVLKDHSSDNVFMSPSSMMVVMTMLHLGARNKTEEQMTKVLKFEDLDKNSILRHMEKFVSTLKMGSKSVTLKAANCLFPHTDKSILEDYISLVSKHFKAEVKPMDYTRRTEESRHEINRWVEQETNNKITDLLPGGSLTSLTAMVVVNAIYFKGNWANQFEPKDTRKNDFTKLNSEVVQVDMMHKRMKKVKYGENTSHACKILELPYDGNEVAMVIILPNSANGLPALEKQLTLNSLHELVSGVHQSTVDVSLPKFKLETSLQLKEVFTSLGMQDLFDEVNSDLSGIGNDLYVSQVFHKAFVDVNEEGTEAAAATAAVLMTRSFQRTLDFKADHPFLFMIWDHRLKVPLFIGRFIYPPSTTETMFQQTRDEL